MVGAEFLTLEKAIELGEYQPAVLEQFAEFRKLSSYSRFQLIRKALKNRERQLRLHWADLSNQLDFSEKPYLKKALKNVKEQLDRLAEEEEKLLIEYSGE
jgi:ABC-type phosphate transport system auxiliary subunit